MPLVLLLLAALVLRLFAASLDPYLSAWDEVVHAMVAKNMLHDPFKPMLIREEALQLDSEEWTNNHVWLHKQPFFLWFIAISIKLFGATPFAVRIPTIIAGVFFVFFTHGIARSLGGRRTGFAAALLAAWAYWLVKLATGDVVSDHNNAIFITLVAGSLWCWYGVSGAVDGRRALWIGLFAGAAVLTKWLPGLAVYLGWGLAVVRTSMLTRQHDGWRPLLLSVSVAAAVFIPWQVYALLRFPREMLFELGENSRHVTEVVEGHSGGPDFHFNAIAELLPPFGPWLIFGGVLFLFLGVPRRLLAWHMAVTVVAVYGFFSLAATKMPPYPMLVLPFLLAGVARLMDRLADVPEWGRASKLVYTGSIALVAGLMFRIEDIQIWHTAQCGRQHHTECYREQQLGNMAMLEGLHARIGTEGRVILFNVPYPMYLQYAFAYGHEAQPGMPSAGQVARLKEAGYRVVVALQEGEEAKVPVDADTVRFASQRWRRR